MPVGAKKMIKILKKLLRVMLKKGTAVFVCTAFVFTSHPMPEVKAEISSGPTLSYRSLLDDMSMFTLSKDIGKIQETYRGATDKVVVLIQDAHSIPDAQRSIQSTIDHFQTEYGISLVGLEGASEKLDPQIFKSFPDKELLQKTFDAYAERGELTGGTAAALFNTSPVIYQGVEDWPLYEEGISYFLEATKRAPEMMKSLQPMFDSLEREKQGVYSKELLELDRMLTSFSENEIDLVQVLKQLSQYQEPEKDSELAVLLKEIERKPELDTAIEIEIKKIAEKFESILKGLPTPVTTSGELQEFNKNYQDFQTSRMTPQAFALYLKDGIKKHNIKVKVSRALVSLVENQRKLKDIEGTQLFKEFEHYADVVKESLFQNDEQKILDRKAQGLALIKRLNQLELSFEDWEKIQKMILQLDQWTVTQDGVVNRDEVSSLLKKMESHLAFYRVAEKRDAVFFKNIQAMMKRENKTTSLLVAGGFHTEGLTKTFKEKGISYVLVTPSIKAIPEEPLYLQHMQGQVSWSDYFEVKNGKVNLYDAFVRATRDKLLSHKEAFANYGKEWRDQIIRDLAATGRITQASEYTRFIDETLQTENQNKIKIERIRDAWLANIDRFDDGLKNLQMKGNLNEANIASLIKTITTAELATSNIFGVNTKSELRLLPWLQQSLAEKSPVDIRSEMRTTDVQSQDLTPMSDRVIPEGYRNIALVMESRGQGFGIPGAMITLVRNLQASYGENVNIRVLVPERMKTAGWLGAAANDFENFRSRLPAGVELETYRDLSQNAQADVAVYYGYSDMGTSYLKNATLPGVKVAYHIPMYIYGYDKEFGRYKNVIDAQGTVHHVVPTANASGSNSNLFLDDFLTRERLKIESLPEGEVRKQRAEILDALKLPNNTTVLESAWAYAYTQSSEALEDYIQNLRKYAARTGQKVTLFLVRGSEINKKTFRSKADYSEVKIVQLEPSLDKKDSYNKILLLTGSLTKDGNDTSRLMADVPNLVTGSQSFSEALASLTLLSHDAFNVNPEEGRGLVAALFKKGFPEFIEKYNPGFKDPDWSVLFTGEVDGSPIEDWSSAQMIADFRAELLPFLKQNNVVNTITDGILQNARGDIHDTVTLEQIQQAESPKVLAVMEFLDDLFYRKLPEFYAGSPKKGEYFLFNEGSVEDIWVEDVIPRGYESAKGTAVVNLRKQGIASFESIRKAWGYEGDQEMTPAIEGKPREDYGEVIDIALKFLRLLLRDSTGATQVNYVGLPIGQHISDKAGGTRQGGQLDRHELRSEGVEKISAARAELANFLNTSDLVQALNKVFSDTEWAVKNSEGKTGSLKFKRVPLENSDDVAFEIQHIGNTSTNETPREFYFRVDPNHQQQIVLEFAYTYAPLELVAKISQILRAIAPQKDTAPSVILKGVVYNLTTLLQLAESVPESEQGDAKDLIQSLRGRIEKDEDIDVRLDKEIFNFKFDSDRRELTEVVVNYLQRGGKISPQDILRTRLGNLAGIFSTDVALKVEDDQLYIQSTFSEAAEKTSAFQLTDESEALQFVDPEIENMINRGSKPIDSLQGKNSDRSELRGELRIEVDESYTPYIDHNKTKVHPMDLEAGGVGDKLLSDDVENNEVAYFQKTLDWIKQKAIEIGDAEMLKHLEKFDINKQVRKGSLNANGSASIDGTNIISIHENYFDDLMNKKNADYDEIEMSFRETVIHELRHSIDFNAGRVDHQHRDKYNQYEILAIGMAAAYFDGYIQVDDIEAPKSFVAVYHFDLKKGTKSQGFTTEPSFLELGANDFDRRFSDPASLPSEQSEIRGRNSTAYAFTREILDRLVPPRQEMRAPSESLPKELLDRNELRSVRQHPDFSRFSNQRVVSQFETSELELYTTNLNADWTEPVIRSFQRSELRSSKIETMREWFVEGKRRVGFLPSSKETKSPDWVMPYDVRLPGTTQTVPVWIDKTLIEVLDDARKETEQESLTVLLLGSSVTYSLLGQDGALAQKPLNQIVGDIDYVVVKSTRKNGLPSIYPNMKKFLKAKGFAGDASFGKAPSETALTQNDYSVSNIPLQITVSKTGFHISFSVEAIRLSSQETLGEADIRNSVEDVKQKRIRKPLTGNVSYLDFIYALRHMVRFGFEPDETTFDLMKGFLKSRPLFLQEEVRDEYMLERLIDNILKNPQAKQLGTIAREFYSDDLKAAVIHEAFLKRLDPKWQQLVEALPQDLIQSNAILRDIKQVFEASDNERPTFLIQYLRNLNPDGVFGWGAYDQYRNFLAEADATADGLHQKLIRLAGESKYKHGEVGAVLKLNEVVKGDFLKQEEKQRLIREYAVIHPWHSVEGDTDRIVTELLSKDEGKAGNKEEEREYWFYVDQKGDVAGRLNLIFSNKQRGPLVDLNIGVSPFAREREVDTFLMDTGLEILKQNREGKIKPQRIFIGARPELFLFYHSYLTRLGIAPPDQGIKFERTTGWYPSENRNYLDIPIVAIQSWPALAQSRTTAKNISQVQVDRHELRTEEKFERFISLIETDNAEPITLANLDEGLYILDRLSLQSPEDVSGYRGVTNYPLKTMQDETWGLLRGITEDEIQRYSWGWIKLDEIKKLSVEGTAEIVSVGDELVGSFKTDQTRFKVDVESGRMSSSSESSIFVDPLKDTLIGYDRTAMVDWVEYQVKAVHQLRWNPTLKEVELFTTIEYTNESAEEEIIFTRVANYLKSDSGDFDGNGRRRAQQIFDDLRMARFPAKFISLMNDYRITLRHKSFIQFFEGLVKERGRENVESLRPEELRNLFVKFLGKTTVYDAVVYPNADLNKEQLTPPEVRFSSAFHLRFQDASRAIHEESEMMRYYGLNQVVSSTMGGFSLNQPNGDPKEQHMILASGNSIISHDENKSSRMFFTVSEVDPASTEKNAHERAEAIARETAIADARLLIYEELTKQWLITHPRKGASDLSTALEAAAVAKTIHAKETLDGVRFHPDLAFDEFRKYVVEVREIEIDQFDLIRQQGGQVFIEAEGARQLANKAFPLQLSNTSIDSIDANNDLHFQGLLTHIPKEAVKSRRFYNLSQGIGYGAFHKQREQRAVLKRLNSPKSWRYKFLPFFGPKILRPVTDSSTATGVKEFQSLQSESLSKGLTYDDIARIFVTVIGNHPSLKTDIAAYRLEDLKAIPDGISEEERLGRLALKKELEDIKARAASLIHEMFGLPLIEAKLVVRLLDFYHTGTTHSDYLGIFRLYYPGPEKNRHEFRGDETRDVTGTNEQIHRSELRNMFPDPDDDPEAFAEFLRQNAEISEAHQEILVPLEEQPDAQVYEELKLRMDQSGFGAIPFSEFMDVAISAYYDRHAKIGDEFHFTTYPEMTTAFGEGMATQLYELWEKMGKPQEFPIIEMGAGNGILGREILNTIRDKYPKFYGAAKYTIIEKSSGLLANQKENLSDHAVNFINQSAIDIPIKNLKGVFISNELPDAFPVERVRLNRLDFKTLEQSYVTYETDAESGQISFKQQWRELSDNETSNKIIRYVDDLRKIRGEAFVDRQLSLEEITINFNAFTWQANLAKALEQGYVITVDYGLGKDNWARRASESVRTYFGLGRGDVNDAFRYPGKVDITADVDFLMLLEEGKKHGLQPVDSGLERQGDFFENLGFQGSVLEILKERKGFFVAIQSKGMMESSSLQGMSQTPLKRAELREMSLAKRQIIDAKVLGLAGGAPIANRQKARVRSEMRSAGLVIADEARNFIEGDVKHAIQSIISDQPRQTSLGKLSSGLLAFKNYLRELGQKAGLHGPTVFVPFGGFDVTKQLNLIPDATDVVSQGVDLFGPPVDIVKYANSPNSDKVGWQGSGVDLNRDTEHIKHELGLQGLGALAVSRLISLMNAELLGLYYFTVDENGELNFAETGDAELEHHNAVLKFTVPDPVTGQLVEKRWWYFADDFSKDNAGFEKFLDSFQFQSLLILGEPSLFENEITRERAIKRALLAARRNNARVFTDRRVSPSGSKTVPLFIRPIWAPGYEPAQIIVAKDQHPVGYSSSGEPVFFGDGSMLITVQTPIDKIKGYIYPGAETIRPIYGYGGEAAKPLTEIKVAMDNEKSLPDELKPFFYDFLRRFLKEFFEQSFRHADLTFRPTIGDWFTRRMAFAGQTRGHPVGFFSLWLSSASVGATWHFVYANLEGKGKPSLYLVQGGFKNTSNDPRLDARDSWLEEMAHRIDASLTVRRIDWDVFKKFGGHPELAAISDTLQVAKPDWVDIVDLSSVLQLDHPISNQNSVYEHAAVVREAGTASFQQGVGPGFLSSIADMLKPKTSATEPTLKQALFTIRISASSHLEATLKQMELPSDVSFTMQLRDVKSADQIAPLNLTENQIFKIAEGVTALSLGRSELRAVYEITIRGDRDVLIAALRSVVEERTAQAMREGIEKTSKGVSADVRVQVLAEERKRILASLMQDLPSETISIGLMIDASDNRSFISQFIRVLQDSHLAVEVIAKPELLNDALLRQAGSELLQKRTVGKKGFSGHVMALGVNSEIPLGFDPRLREKGMRFADAFQPLSTNLNEVDPRDTLMRDHIEWLLAISLIKMAEIVSNPESGYEKFMQEKSNALKQSIKDPKEFAKAMKLTKAEYLKTQLELSFGITAMFKANANGELALMGSIVQAYIASEEFKKSA